MSDRYTAAERMVAFWAKVARAESADGCWLWTGAISGTGYGSFTRHHGASVAAHVFAWELAHGPVPEGRCVLHRCDNRACARPGHLFLGTKAANSADMVSKGRSPRGSRNGHSKLTEADVVEIRASSASNKAIAEHLGVSRSLISLVRNRRIWKHV